MFTTSYEKAEFSSPGNNVSFLRDARRANILSRFRRLRQKIKQVLSQLEKLVLPSGGSAAAAAHYNVTTAASSSGDNAEGHSTDGIFPLALPPDSSPTSKWL